MQRHRFVAVGGGFALTILVFQPGYPTRDARYLNTHAMVWNFTDWQSLVVGLLWQLMDPLARYDEHVPADRLVLLAGVRPPRVHRGAAVALARGCGNGLSPQWTPPARARMPQRGAEVAAARAPASANSCPVRAG